MKNSDNQNSKIRLNNYSEGRISFDLKSKGNQNNSHADQNMSHMQHPYLNQNDSNAEFMDDSIERQQLNQDHSFSKLKVNKYMGKYNQSKKGLDNIGKTMQKVIQVNLTRYTLHSFI